LSLSTVRVGGDRPDDGAYLDRWGRNWLQSHGYTYFTAPSFDGKSTRVGDHESGLATELAGSVARLYHLYGRGGLEEMHRMAAPHKHPSRRPQPKPEPTADVPPATRKRGEPKGKTLKLRLPEEELSAWKSLAERHGRSLSDLVRTSVRDELEFDQATENEKR
jgi:hypothetical protein